MNNRIKAELMDEVAMGRAIKRIAHEIIERNKGTENLVLIGVQRRGVPLAQRIGQIIMQEENVELPVGTLDITFYRDDLSQLLEHPQVMATDIPVSVTINEIIEIIKKYDTPKAASYANGILGSVQKNLEEKE